jgi:hypothetical protein
MRNAPSVVYPVGRSAFYGRVLVLLGALSLLTWFGWGATQLWAFHQLGVWLAGIVAWSTWVAWVWRSWRRTPVGQLRWDAQASRVDDPLRVGAWRWCRAVAEDGVPLLAVELALDLQTRALLRLRGADASSRWVWVERSGDASRWNDLRRALVRARS